MEHIDEFLSGLSQEELQYIADKAEVLLTEKTNMDNEDVSLNDFDMDEE